MANLNSSTPRLLLGLSQDVVYLICELLSSADILSLSLTSTILHRMVETIIYSSVELRWKHRLFPPLIPLTRTLLARPELGTYVKHVRLQGFASYLTFPPYGTPPNLRPRHEDLVEPIAFIRRTGVPFIDDWIEGLCHGSIDAWVAVVLLQFPNMRTLHISLEFIQKTEFLGLAFQAALAEPSKYHLPLFGSLYSLTINTLRDRN